MRWELSPVLFKEPHHPGLQGQTSRVGFLEKSPVGKGKTQNRADCPRMGRYLCQSVFAEEVVA